MRTLVWALTFFLTFSVGAQETSYLQDALKYFELNGTEKQYNQAVDQMFDLLRQQYSSANVPEEVWKQLATKKPGAITNIKSLLVSAYRGNFSHADIKELIKFYDSSIGRQLVLDRTAVSSEQQEELSKFFNSEVGLKMQNQSESLKSMVSEVSELWSRDLYREALGFLKEKGYQVTPQ